MGNSALSPRPAKIHIDDSISQPLKLNPTKANDPKKLIEAAVKRKNWDEVATLLVKYSASIQAMSNDNPLDLAVVWNCPLDVIKIVVSLDPIKAFTVINAKRQTALHLALKSERDFEVIEYLIDEVPDVLSETDADGNIPLHTALAHRTHFGIIKYLLEKSPDTIRTRTKVGGYSLHVALEHRQPENIIMYIIDAYPSAMQQSALGFYPIHLACKQAYSNRVIEKIICGCNDAAMLSGPDSNLPLHYAAMTNKTHPEVIEILTRLNPDGILHRSKKGSMPLHLALEHRWHESKLLALIRQCPDAVKQRGRGTPGDFPLSIAIEYHASNLVLEALLQVFPKACEHMNVYRMYLLRSAVRAKVHWNIVEKIVEAYPNAASERDSTSQRVALHYAISRSYPLSLVAKIIAAFPPGVSAGDVHGLLPLHIAATRAGTLALTRDAARTYLPDNAKTTTTSLVVAHSEKDIAPTSDVTQEKAVLEEQEGSVTVETMTVEDRLDYDLKLFRMLVLRFPESVTALDKYGLSPINYLIENTQVLHQDQSNSGKIISHVGVALLQCLCESDGQRQLPAHQRKIIRIGNEAPLDPAAFKSAFVPIPVTPKINPLHHAIHCNRDVDYIQVILDYDPNLASATALDEAGQTTLHAAIVRRMATKCLLAIIAAAPAAVKVRDKEQFLPIHYAIMYQAERVVVQQLLALYPDVTRIVDDVLHIQAANIGMVSRHMDVPNLPPLSAASRPETAPMLLDSTASNTTMQPESALTATVSRRIVAESGHYMFFHFSVHHKVDAAILADIISYTMPYMPPAPEQLAQRAADGRDTIDDHFHYQEAHFYLWYDLICHTYDVYPETINVLFDDYQYTTRVIQLLCDFPNRHLPSRVTLSMATPRCHEQLISRLYYYQRYSWLPPRRDDHVDVVEEDAQTSVTLSNQKEILSFHHRSKYAMCKVAFDHHQYPQQDSLPQGDDASMHTANTNKNSPNNVMGTFGFRHFQPKKVMLKFSQQRSTFDTEVVFRKNVLIQIEKRVEEEWHVMEAKRKKLQKKQLKEIQKLKQDTAESTETADHLTANKNGSKVQKKLQENSDEDEEDEEDDEDNFTDEEDEEQEGNNRSNIQKNNGKDNDVSSSNVSQSGSKTTTRSHNYNNNTVDVVSMQKDAETVTQYSRLQEHLEEEREIQGKKWCAKRVQTLLRRFFLEMVTSYDAESDTEYRAELQRQRFVQEYPLLMVTVHACRTLHEILLHDHPMVSLQRTFSAKKNNGINNKLPNALSWSQLGVYHTRVHDILYDLCEAIQFLHTLGYVHTNINPMNVYEIRDYQKTSGFRLVLGNFGCMKRAKLDATTAQQSLSQQPPEPTHVPEIANLYAMSDVIDVETQDLSDNRAYGYMAPELARCYLLTQQHHHPSSTAVSGTAAEAEVSVAVTAQAAALQTMHAQAALSTITRPATHDRPEQSEQRERKMIRLDATFALDVWSIGAIAYHLGAGEPLLHASFDQRIDNDQLQLLAQWNKAVKDRRLERVNHHVWLRHLVQQWLSIDDHLRFDVNYVLQRHPFFTAKEGKTTPSLVTNITGLPSSVVSDEQPLRDDELHSSTRTELQKNRLRFIAEPPVYDFYVVYNHCHFAYDKQQRDGKSRKVLTTAEKEKSIRSDDQMHFVCLLDALRQYCADIRVTGSDSFASNASAPSPSLVQARRSNNNNTTAAATTVAAAPVKQPIPAQVILDLSHRNKTTLLYDSLPPPPPVVAPAPDHVNAAAAAGNTKTINNTKSNSSNDSHHNGAVNKASQDVQILLTEILQRQSQAKSGLIVLTHHGVNHPAELDERNDPQSITTLNICRLVKSSPLYLFIFELVLMLELQARGWFENGIYILLAGDNVSKSIEEEYTSSNNSASSTAVFGPFFEHFTTPVDKADPMYVPPNADNPLDNVTMLKQVGNCFPLPNLISQHQLQSVRLAVQTVLEIHGLGKTLYYPSLTMKELFLQILLPLPSVQYPVLHLLGPANTAYQRAALDLLRLTHPTLPLYRHLDSSGRVSSSRRGAVSRSGLSSSSSHGRTAGTSSPPRISRSSHGNSRNGRLLLNSNGVHNSNNSALLTTNVDVNIRHSMDVSAVGMTQAFQKMLDMRVPSPSFHNHSQVAEHWFEDREPLMPKSAIGSRAPSRQGAVGLRPVEEENLRLMSPAHYQRVSDMINPLYSSNVDATKTAHTPTHTAGQTGKTEEGGKFPAPSYRDSAQNAEILIIDRPVTASASAVANSVRNNVVSSSSTSMSLLSQPLPSATAPFFTELIADQQNQNIDMLRFCIEKTEAKENEVNNLKLELALMQEHMRLQQLEIIRLRNLVQVTSIRELPPTYIEDDEDGNLHNNEDENAEGDEEGKRQILNDEEEMDYVNEYKLHNDTG